MTPEPSINMKCPGGAELDVQLDGDGDLYVGVTNDTTAALYLNKLQAVELRNWLTKVLAESPHEANPENVIDAEYHAEHPPMPCLQPGLHPDKCIEHGAGQPPESYRNEGS